MNEMFWKHEYLTLKEVEIPKLIAEFLSRLNWICERVEFHTENPDSELMDELLGEFREWEKRKK